FLVPPPPPSSTLFPYTTLFRSFRNVNIALANELALMCRHLGMNTREVIDAAATKPFGFTPFYPGPGIGGHCIPVDPNYLAWKMRDRKSTRLNSSHVSISYAVFC